MFLRDQASDSDEVVTPLMLDGTYLSRNFATLGPMIRQPPCEGSWELPSFVSWEQEEEDDGADRHSSSRWLMIHRK